jgi:hypothetical protein
MFTHPDDLGQLVRENYRQMLAQAGQRQLRRQHGQRSTRTRPAAGTIIRRLATLIAKPDDIGSAQPGHSN